MDGAVRFHLEHVIGVGPAGCPNQGLGKIGMDAPVTFSIGSGQCAPDDGTSKSRVKGFPALNAGTGLNVPQTFA